MRLRSLAVVVLLVPLLAAAPATQPASYLRRAADEAFADPHLREEMSTLVPVMVISVRMLAHHDLDGIRGLAERYERIPPGKKDALGEAGYYQQLSEWAWITGDNAKAEAMAKRCESLISKSPDYLQPILKLYLQVQKILLHPDQFDAAIQAVAPDDRANVLLQLAGYWIRTRDFVNADRAIQKLLALLPQGNVRDQRLSILANALARHGALPRAEILLAEMRSSRHQRSTLGEIADAKRAAGDIAGATADARKAFELFVAEKPIDILGAEYVALRLHQFALTSEESSLTRLVKDEVDHITAPSERFNALCDLAATYASIQDVANVKATLRLVMKLKAELLQDQMIANLRIDDLCRALPRANDESVLMELQKSLGGELSDELRDSLQQGFALLYAQQGRVKEAHESLSKVHDPSTRGWALRQIGNALVTRNPELAESFLAMLSSPHDRAYMLIGMSGPD